MPAPRADGRAARAGAGRLAALASALVLVGTPATGAAAASAPAQSSGVTELAIIVPVVAPPIADGTIPADELTALTGPAGSLTQVLDVIGAREVTLAVDPLIAASVDALGSDAPASARAWIDRLDAAPQDRFPLLLGDADPTLLRQSGSVLPALGTVWPAPGTVSIDDITAFSEAGALRVLLSDADLAARPDASTALASAGVDAGVAVVDGAASAALVAAVAEPSPETLGALRTAIAGDGARRSIVAALPRAVTDLSGLDEVLEALDGDLGLDLVGLDALSGETPQVELAAGAQPPDRLERYRQLVAAEQADAVFAGIAADPDRIREAARQRSLVLASVAWAGSPEWAPAVAEAIEDSIAMRSAVRIVESDSLFLADRSRIPVTIINDLVQPVTVVVSVRSGSARLDLDDRPVTVEVPASARISVAFDATAVSNGTVAVTARLTAADGTPVGDPAVGVVNVQAGWETPIVAGAAGVLLLIVVIGIVRTARRIRRARAEAAAPADERATAQNAMASDG